MTYTDMDIARSILKEAERIFDFMSMLVHDDDMLTRTTLSTMAHITWRDMIELRCELEELTFERNGYR